MWCESGAKQSATEVNSVAYAIIWEAERPFLGGNAKNSRRRVVFVSVIGFLIKMASEAFHKSTQKRPHGPRPDRFDIETQSESKMTPFF